MFLKVRRKRYASPSNYPKMEKEYCSDMYEVNNYPTFNDAMTACENDVVCGGVYDKDCDNAGSFTLCPKNYQKSSSVNSCTYLSQGSIL